MSRLRDEFRDSDYRRAYAESFANTIIATQIRLLRGKLSQKEFAKLVGLKQSRISAMEDENYSSWSTKTLKRLAASTDVVFLGRFVSFGELLDWSRRMSEANLRAISFKDDPVFHRPDEGSSSTAKVFHFSTVGPNPVRAAVERDASTTNAKVGVSKGSKTRPLPLFDALADTSAQVRVVNG